eukprot:7270125-Pyramimonas_sp.AAC.1
MPGLHGGGTGRRPPDRAMRSVQIQHPWPGPHPGLRSGVSTYLGARNGYGKNGHYAQQPMLSQTNSGR